MSVNVLAALEAVKKLNNELSAITLPEREITNFRGKEILPINLFKDTRRYLEKVAIQINQCYESTCYDACAVMIRRLVETLIIECFEGHQIADKIKDAHDDYFMLSDLIGAFLSEKWNPNISRNLKKYLPEFKGIGDKSAHSRFYNAQRSDVDDVKSELRYIVEELLYLSKLKK
jgi:hypothetical protein